MRLGEKIFQCLEELSAFSTGGHEGRGVTRLFLTDAHKSALVYLEKLMQDAGLTTEVDAIGNLIGRYIYAPEAKTLVLGSHQDTVKCGGKYDGALGVVLPICCVSELIKNKQLSCNVTVVAFADEEGVRFQTTYLGSMAFNGRFDAALLERCDENGISLYKALQNFGANPDGIQHIQPKPIDGYVEVHIEQGPVLEKENLAVGIVSSIQSSYRFEVSIQGMAGHAGTVPMALRQDPMLSASKIIQYLLDQVAQKAALVATVGALRVLPGAVNVIPSQVIFSVDIRSPHEENIHAMMQDLTEKLEVLCKANGTEGTITQVNQVPATHCHARIMEKLASAMEASQTPVFHLVSGAGHDAQEMAHVTDVGMLFVRCKKGISHNPEEAVSVDDIHSAACVISKFIEDYTLGA